MNLNPLPYFDTVGWTTYKNQPAYVAGNKVITANGLLNSSEFYVSEELQSLYFEFNSKLKQENGCYYFINLLRLNGNSLVLGMTLITSLLYSFFEEAGHPPCFTTYCVEKSQTKKTTLARLICSIYNKNEESGAAIMDLLSTATALKIKPKNSRIVVLFLTIYTQVNVNLKCVTGRND
ncbi:MAG: hypothetical protein LKJ25_00100 [Clostridia bacterium]|jgi:hypothetical protein|nr:hypothetical protein [Clostridia bacterium]